MSQTSSALAPEQHTAPLPAGLPHVAVLLLWYPLFTQPFIFREIENLRTQLPLEVYSLYGRNLACCSTEMHAAADRVHTLGLRALPAILRDLLLQAVSHPRRLGRLLRQVLFHRWSSLEVLGENLWAFLAGIHLARLLREDGMDMIYAPWPRGTATAARVASALTGMPYATSARGDNLQPADPDLADKLREALFVRANNAADKERIETFAEGVARGKTELVYNSLTLPAEGQCPVRMQPPVRLLALGRFDVTKGFDVLLKACALLRDRQIDFTLMLAGDGGRRFGLGKESRALETLRSQLGLEGRVQMPGLVSHNELPRLLMSHDIFVAPCVIHASGRRDGIPNTVIEALSYGMPVVSTDINALPEVIHHGETGLAVPQQDPEALADAIQWCIAHPEESRRMAENGRRLAKEMFDPQRNAHLLAQLFISRYTDRKKTCAA